MRQVFSSARLENAESVAKLLGDAGIEVRIQGGRTYKGGIRGNFSYRDGHTVERPSVWVVRSDDQTQARALLREHGLLQTTDRAASFLGETPHTRPPPSENRGTSRGRFLLLGAIGIAMIGVFFATRGPREPGPPPSATVSRANFPDPGAPGGLAPIPGEVIPEVHRVPVPPALAAMLFAAEARGASPAACLSVDGEDPSPATLDPLRAAGLAVAPASTCAADGVVLEVVDYRTDGSGSGTVELRRADASTRTRAVRREGREWSLAPGGATRG